MTSAFAHVPIDLMVTPEVGIVGVHGAVGVTTYRVDWWDNEPIDARILQNIPEAWLDLAPLMAARVLLTHGLDPDRAFIVRLAGADYELMRTTLGAAAAKPVVNVAAPVREEAHTAYRRGAYRDGTGIRRRYGRA